MRVIGVLWMLDDCKMPVVGAADTLAAEAYLRSRSEGSLARDPLWIRCYASKVATIVTPFLTKCLHRPCLTQYLHRSVAAMTGCRIVVRPCTNGFMDVPLLAVPRRCETAWGGSSSLATQRDGRATAARSDRRPDCSVTPAPSRRSPAALVQRCDGSVATARRVPSAARGGAPSTVCW